VYESDESFVNTAGSVSPETDVSAENSDDDHSENSVGDDTASGDGRYMSCVTYDNRNNILPLINFFCTPGVVSVVWKS
jgi:hypothetical protein